MNFSVERIAGKDTHDFLLNKHYAQRIPSISYAFGLFNEDKELVGVCTLGRPASRPLCVGVCGPDNADKVFELNRLVVNEGLPKNSLSWFVSRVLRALKDESLVIVSYADTGMNHHGYIYQATNFIYTGLTSKRTDKYMPGNKHPRHYDDTYEHLRKVRTPKHRYIYFTNKKDRKLRESLRYEIHPYPKGENGTYRFGERIKTKVINKQTGEVFYE